MEHCITWRTLFGWGEVEMTPYGIGQQTNRVTENAPNLNIQQHVQQRTSVGQQNPFLPFLYSAHAARRAEQRGVDLTPEEAKRLQHLIGKLAEKKAVNAFVVMKNKSLIVNVPSRKVITVFDNDAMKEKIVTQIDAAAFLPEIHHD